MKSQHIFKLYREAENQKTDQQFAVLLFLQWVLGVVFAIWISPLAWSGEQYSIHVHIYAALFLGGILTVYPIILVIRSPGAVLNRRIIAVSQVCFSILYIHLTGGRIETHFHIFGSMAFLALYRDWQVLLLATIITALDHLIRGIFWPESVYGVLSSTPWRAFEHTAWVLFEDIFLAFSMRNGLRDLHIISEKQAELEGNISLIEKKVNERTRELQESQYMVLEQQQALIAASKLTALGEMAGGIAHEINSPLATIKNLCSQIQEVVYDDPVDRKLLSEMATKAELTTDRIAKIVLGLRSFSRDAGEDPYTQIQVDQLLEETLSFCRERFKNRGIEIVMESYDKSLTFQGRAVQISQVLLNVLNNAFDAIQNQSEKWVRISVEDLGSSFVFKITDSGPGIPKELRNKIFQPFFTTKQIGQGTGMGLSISVGIIRNHSGEFILDSQSKNTCFIIKLPKKQNLSLGAM